MEFNTIVFLMAGNNYLCVIVLLMLQINRLNYSTCLHV